jgi:hypothetical protein
MAPDRGEEILAARVGEGPGRSAAPAGMLLLELGDDPALRPAPRSRACGDSRRSERPAQAAEEANRLVVDGGTQVPRAETRATVFCTSELPGDPFATPAANEVLAAIFSPGSGRTGCP